MMNVAIFRQRLSRAITSFAADAPSTFDGFSRRRGRGFMRMTKCQYNSSNNIDSDNDNYTNKAGSLDSSHSRLRSELDSIVRDSNSKHATSRLHKNKGSNNSGSRNSSSDDSSSSRRNSGSNTASSSRNSSNSYSSRNSNSFNNSSRYGNSSSNNVDYPHRLPKKQLMDYSYDYLYGVSVCNIALKRKHREFLELFIQDSLDVDNKKDSQGAADIIAIGKALNIKTTYMSKHDLNMFSDNRPHQGFVLKSSPLELDDCKCLAPANPYSSSSSSNSSISNSSISNSSSSSSSSSNNSDNKSNDGNYIVESHSNINGSSDQSITSNNSESSSRNNSNNKCVLALDEVADPQNLGALLRTCHFLGVDEVVICSKNSSSLSPAVSKASSGALELMAPGKTLKSTNNMVKFLEQSKLNGWQVVGTAVSGKNVISLDEVPNSKPTILVLGNEGAGMRTNVLRQCDYLVKIQGRKKTVSTNQKIRMNASGSGSSYISNDENVSSAMIVSGSGDDSEDYLDNSDGGISDTPPLIENDLVEDSVESLNVSVSGGILLHGLISKMK